LSELGETFLKTDPITPLDFSPHIAAGKMLVKIFCHTPTFSSLNFDPAHGFGPGDHAHGDNGCFIT